MMNSSKQDRILSEASGKDSAAFPASKGFKISLDKEEAVASLLEIYSTSLRSSLAVVAGKGQEVARVQHLRAKTFI